MACTGVVGRDLIVWTEIAVSLDSFAIASDAITHDSIKMDWIRMAGCWWLSVKFENDTRQSIRNGTRRRVTSHDESQECIRWTRWTTYFAPLTLLTETKN